MAQPQASRWSQLIAKVRYSHACLTASSSGTVLLSGALSALAGFVNVAGQESRLTQSFFRGYGVSGVLIGFLARNNPLAAAVVAVVMGVLFVAGQNLQVFYSVPLSMVQLIQALIVIRVASRRRTSSSGTGSTGFGSRDAGLRDLLARHLAVPYVLAALGLIVSARAGVLSLAAEGLMLIGAVTAVGAVLSLGADPAASLLVGMLAAAVVSVLFAALVV